MIAFSAILLTVAVALAPAPSVSDNDISGNDIVEDFNDEIDPADPEDDLQDSSDTEVSPSVSGNSLPISDDSSFGDFSGEDSVDYGVSSLNNYDVYYGAIGTQYLEFFRGYLPRLGSNDDYVCARVDQYNYIMAYGNIDYAENLFTGTDVTVVTFNTYQNGSFSLSVQSSFSLRPNGQLVYTSLSSPYPSLASSSDFSLRQLVYFAGFVLLFYTFTQLLSSRRIRSRSRRW